VRKVLGMLGLLLAVSLTVTIVEPMVTGRSAFTSAANLRNLATWTGLFGILGVGEAFVIITGGIDLSVGSVVGLVGILSAMFLKDYGMSPAVAVPLVLLISVLMGLVHGLLVTKLRIQPFVVTLCGLLIYRGIARGIAHDETRGFGTGFESLKFLARGVVPGIGVPMPLILLILVAVAATVFLHMSVYGRYLFALGRNEEAARFSGVNVDRMKILAYVICSLLAGFSGLLFALNINSLQPSNFGSFYELYAIAAAVLGGCSLRGGEGVIAGVVIGSAILRVLPNLVNLLGIRSELVFAVIGGVILIGVIADELIRARTQKRMAKERAQRQ